VTSEQPGILDRPRIVVADEDVSVVKFVMDTLRQDGNAVFHEYDALSAVQLACSLDVCHLVITNTQVEGVPSVTLIRELRERLPSLPILYLANLGRSTPEREAQLPSDVRILREPFGVEDLLAAVRPLVTNGHR
jgi:DNA-binding response OmpR family regulator